MRKLDFGPLGLSTKPDPDERNDERAEAALEAVKTFVREIGEEPFPGANLEQRRNLLYQNIKDLLCDLRHLCDRTEIDFDSADAGALRHYEVETESETDLDLPEVSECVFCKNLGHPCFDHKPELAG